jgi:hypothetical protein
MSTHERDELFAALSELAHRYPHWRVGQLVANVAGWADAEIWDAEDGQLLSAAQAHLGAATIPAGATQEAEPGTAPNPAT